MISLPESSRFKEEKEYMLFIDDIGDYFPDDMRGKKRNSYIMLKVEN